MRIVLHSHAQYNMKIAQDCLVTCHDIQLTLLMYFLNYSRKKNITQISGVDNTSEVQKISVEVNTQGIEINSIATGNRMITVYDQVAMLT